MLTPTETQWLDYAWHVATCSPDHRASCYRHRAAPPMSEADGNDLRWPGYLGRQYREQWSVLCVGHVHGANWDNPAARDQLQSGLRAWIASGRSEQSDRTYLEGVRDVFEWWLRSWTRWTPFGKVMAAVGDDVTQIAWTNFAKCRFPEGKNCSRIVQLCQGDYPISEVVEAIRPLAVVTCVLNAYEGGAIVASWKTSHADPLVFTFHGLHGTDRSRRPVRVWAEEAAHLIAGRRGSLTGSTAPIGSARV